MFRAIKDVWLGANGFVRHIEGGDDSEKRKTMSCRTCLDAASGSTSGETMRRFGVLFTLALLISVGMASAARAERATREEMTLVCQNWLTYLTQERGAFPGTASPQVTRVQEIQAGGTLLGLVISLSPTGHVVVPILKEMQPIRAYSDETDVDMNQTDGYAQLIRESLQSRVDLYVATYGSLDAVQPAVGSTLFAREYRTQWDQLLVDQNQFKTTLNGTARIKREGVGPLLRTVWSQGSPYNDLCPGEGQGKTMAGCVAIAAAQIMNYHEWPPQGVGQHSYDWGGTTYCSPNMPPGTLSADFSDSYDWVNMPDSCSSGCTPHQNAAVAELCWEVGVAYESTYDCFGTGAYAETTVEVLPTYFRYHDAIVQRPHSDYPTVETWFKEIKAQIDLDRPMLYTFAFGSSGAKHAVVCDGWRWDFLGTASYWYHINYGWGGSNNAWFVVDHIAYAWNPVQEERFFGNIEPNPILNTPLVDREADGNPYPVTAVFQLPGLSVPRTFAVTYYTHPTGGGPISRPCRLVMSPTGQPREYRALIPAQPANTDVHYYIEGCATPPTYNDVDATVKYTDPLFAPTVQREFLVYDDTQPPTIWGHAPVRDMASWEWPPEVQAGALDDHGIESVEVEWSKNGVIQTPFALEYHEYLNKYVGSFTGSVSGDDAIAYRIKAVDTSIHSNTSFLPESTADPFSFAIVDGIAEDFEPPYTEWEHSAADGWTDSWHVSSARSHSPDQSWHFGSWVPSDGYPELADGSLYTPEVLLGVGAELTFWHSIETAYYLVPRRPHQIYDGGVIEITTDGGQTWLPLVPDEGYDDPIIQGTTGPFEPGRMVFGGLQAVWRQVHVQLAEYAASTVRIRFRFGSDALGSGNTMPGWFIDDVRLTPCGPASFRATTSVPDGRDVELRLRAVPNPFQPQTTISFRIAMPEARVRLEIFDLAGRRVRRLMSGSLGAGLHSYAWDGRGQGGETVQQGIYFARIQVGEKIGTSKLLLLSQ